MAARLNSIKSTRNALIQIKPTRTTKNTHKSLQIKWLIFSNDEVQ